MRTASPEELAAINRFAKTPMQAEDVYVFDMLLCDNDVDRDYERFTTKALEELAPLFVGKTGIFDHDWTAGGQIGRIFRTEVVTDKSRDRRAVCIFESIRLHACERGECAADCGY